MTIKKNPEKDLIEQKTLKVNFSTKAFDSESDGEYYLLEGYASVFGNIDSYGDIMVKGAFTESLAERLPAFCYQHWMSDVIGVIYEAKEDDKGLFIKAKIPKEHTQGKDVALLIKCGGITEMSIGYVELDSIEEKIDGVEVVRVTKVKLYEVSPVTRAANDQAVFTSFKSANSVKELEEGLKSTGLSRKEAKIIYEMFLRGWYVIE